MDSTPDPTPFSTDLKPGYRWTNRSELCLGCKGVIDCSGHYLILSLWNNDSSLEKSDLRFVYFHSEHCVAIALSKSLRPSVPSWASSAFMGG